ncbi:MAG: Wzt carbohydrate-binding domain-containing protein, partial [Thermodesulfobacteriota bacterium]
IAVGDEYFRGKCFNKINDLKRRGKTLVLVTHSLYNLRSICDRVLLLEKGRLVADGSADEVVDRYLTMVQTQREEQLGALNKRVEEETSPPRWGGGGIRVKKVRLLDRDEKERSVYRPNETMVIDAEYEVTKTTRKPVFGIGIFRSDGTYVSGLNHLWHREPMEIDELREGTGGHITCTIKNLPLLKGSYYISYYCYDHSEPVPTPIDHMEKAIAFEVMEGNVIEHGLVSIGTAWNIKEEANGPH